MKTAKSLAARYYRWKCGHALWRHILSGLDNRTMTNASDAGRLHVLGSTFSASADGGRTNSGRYGRWLDGPQA